MSMVRSFLYSLSVIAAIISFSAPADTTNQDQGDPLAGSTGAFPSAGFKFESPTIIIGIDEQSQGDRQTLGEIINILRKIETGRWSLEVIQAFDVTVIFKPAEGSHFIPNKNEITIDSDQDLLRATLSIVHESTHAYYQHEGLNADIIVDDRQTYISKQIGEEVEAVSNSIKAKMELEESAMDMSEIRYPMEYPYRKAFETAVEMAQADKGDLSIDSLYLIGNDAGKEVLLQGYLEGKMWTSITKESYPDYFGRHWDRIHESPRISETDLS